MKEIIMHFGEFINSYQSHGIVDGLYDLLTKIVYKV